MAQLGIREMLMEFGPLAGMALALGAAAWLTVLRLLWQDLMASVTLRDLWDRVTDKVYFR
jgi:hypothetical protein